MQVLLDSEWNRQLIYCITDVHCKIYKELGMVNSKTGQVFRVYEILDEIYGELAFYTNFVWHLLSW